MDEKRAASLLGIAVKAGKTVSGEDSVLKNIRSAKAKLVLLSSEASERTKGTFRDKCSHYRVPLYELGTKEELGRILGKGVRTVVCILDENLAEGIEKLLTAAPREED